jgi:hypothetical protein
VAAQHDERPHVASQYVRLQNCGWTLICAETVGTTITHSLYMATEIFPQHHCVKVVFLVRQYAIKQALLINVEGDCKHAKEGMKCR